MQAVVADIEALGASMVIVSPQLEKYSRQVAQKYKLGINVLSDPGNKVAEKYGLVYRLPEDLKALYHKFGVDLNRFYGNNEGSLPMPGRFIIDCRGMVIHADVHPDYTKRPEPTDIPEIIKRIVSTG